MIYLIWVHQKKKVLSSTESLAWISIWIVFIGLALFPDSLRGIVSLLHFTRVFDLLLVMALMVITVVVFVSYVKQKGLERRIEELVRTLAIDTAVKAKKPKK